jgi:hypothetical protein
MDLDKEIFKGKTLSDIVKEAYEKHKEQDSLINNEISKLAEMISSPGEALAIAPIIKPLIDSSLKNDEVLVKILNLFQKAQSAESRGQDSEGILTAKDIEQLWSNPMPYEKEEKKKLIDGL